MLHYLKIYLLTILVMAVIDFIGLKFLSKYYRPRLNSWSQSKNQSNYQPKEWLSNLSYLIIPAIITIVVISRFEEFAWLAAMKIGAVIGLLTYGLYDLYSYTLQKNFSLNLLTIDICWGTTLCCLSTVAATWLNVH